MSIGESAGSVFVTIDGDSSPLLAKYAQAESLSRAAGQKISGALAQGTQQTAQLFDYLGRDITKSMEQAAPAVQQVTTQVVRLGQAVPAIQQATVQMTNLGKAAHGVVPEVAAASGAIRVLEGNMPIRAVERFATNILGLGPLLQAAFPLVGAIALGEMIFHVAEKFTGMSEAETKAAEDAKKFVAELRQINQEIAGINVELFKLLYGTGAANAAKVAALQAQLAATDRVIAEREKLKNGGGIDSAADAKERTATAAQLGIADPNSKKDTKEEIQSLALLKDERAKILAQMNVANAEYQITAVAAEQKLTDERKRAASEAAREEERAAREAEALAKRQQEAIVRTVREGSKLIAEEEKKQLQEVDRALKTLLSEADSDAKQIIEQNLGEIRATVKQADELARIGIRRTGAQAEGGNEMEKVKAQIAYNDQLVHTARQKIAYEQQLADIEDRGRQIKIDQLQAELQQDRLAGDTVKAAEDQMALDTATDAAEAAQAASAAQIAHNTRAGSLGGQVGATLAGGVDAAPDAIVGAVVKGIGDGHIGQQIREAMTGIGKQMMGDVLKELIAATIGNTLATLENTIATDALKVIEMVKTFLGFADGGRPPVGVPSMVGERGPELFIPDGAGTIIPNHALNSGAIANHATRNYLSSASSSMSIGAIHLHGVQTPHDMVRAMPDVLKRMSAKFSPSGQAWSPA